MREPLGDGHQEGGEGPLELLAWPNPLSDADGMQLQLSLASARSLDQAKIYNMAGELVAEYGAQMGNQWALDLNGKGLSSGVYILTARVETSVGDLIWLKQKIAILR